MADHARLSASGAYRWMSCPGSIAAEEAIRATQPPEPDSPAAVEGTLAHSLAEFALRAEFALGQEARVAEIASGWAGLSSVRDVLARPEAHLFNLEEAIPHVQTYVDYVRERSERARALRIEHRADFSLWVPGGFGTADVVIVRETGIEVVDLKYGKGIRVYADDNPQLRLYGLGSLSEFAWMYPIDRVAMTIVQPRLDHIDSVEMALGDLMSWGEEVVTLAADAAIAPEAPRTPSESACRWCLARSTCKERADSVLYTALADFETPTHGLSLGESLARVAEVRAWCNDIEAAANQRALAGDRVDGHKLVRGKRGNRYVKDPAATEAALKKRRFKVGQIYQPRKLLGVPALEKLVGREWLAPHIDQPEGNLILVPDDDPRPEVTIGDSAEADFS